VPTSTRPSVSPAAAWGKVCGGRVLSFTRTRPSAGTRAGLCRRPRSLCPARPTRHNAAASGPGPGASAACLSPPTGPSFYGRAPSRTSTPCPWRSSPSSRYSLIASLIACTLPGTRWRRLVLHDCLPDCRPHCMLVLAGDGWPHQYECRSCPPIASLISVSAPHVLRLPHSSV